MSSKFSTSKLYCFPYPKPHNDSSRIDEEADSGISQGTEQSEVGPTRDRVGKSSSYGALWIERNTQQPQALG